MYFQFCVKNLLTKPNLTLDEFLYLLLMSPYQTLTKSEMNTRRANTAFYSSYSKNLGNGVLPTFDEGSSPRKIKKNKVFCEHIFPNIAVLIFLIFYFYGVISIFCIKMKYEISLKNEIPKSGQF